MFEPAIDRLRGTVGGSGAVEVGQDIGGAFLQRVSQHGDFPQRGGDALADRGDQLGHQVLALRAVGFAVGGDHTLVDAPGRVDLDVLVGREQGLQPVLLLLGEQVQTGVQGPPRSIERVMRTARWPWSCCWTRRWHRSSASPARRATWKGPMTATAPGSSSAVAVLKPLNPSIATTSSPSRHVWGRSASQDLNTALERPCAMSSSRAGPGRGQVDDHGDIPVPAPRMPPHVLINPCGGHPEQWSLKPKRTL